MTPVLEMVRITSDTSFKAWSHGYPFRTVRWHFHPEYELHLVTSTRGTRYVGDHIAPFGPGDLVLTGPNLPHNWISDLHDGETVPERCHILQFSDTFMARCIEHLPELRGLTAVLASAQRGLWFKRDVAKLAVAPMRSLLEASGPRRIAYFMEILDVITTAPATPLASIAFRPDATSFRATRINLALEHIARNFTQELNETEMSALCQQSVSTFSRSFLRHTGMNFVQYVNALRVELACQHLTLDTLSITDICYEVGFRNVSNFNRQFLAIKGMSPSRFRALQRASRTLAIAS